MKSKRTYTELILLFVTMVILAACNLPSPGAPSAPVTNGDQVIAPSAHDWEEDFIEGCQANSGLPFEWDYGIGCDFEIEEDVFCTYDDKCDSGWLIDLDAQNDLGNISKNVSDCQNGEIIPLASVGNNGKISIDEVCATGTKTTIKEEGVADFPSTDFLNVEINTAGQQAKKTQITDLEENDQHRDINYLKVRDACDLIDGTPESSRMPNGDFYIECHFDDGDTVTCDNYGCYPPPDTSLLQVFPKLNAIETAAYTLQAVAIKDDDLDDLTEICELDGGDASETPDGKAFFCLYEDVAVGEGDGWFCEDDFWGEGQIKCGPLVVDEPDEKKSETDQKRFPGSALNALDAVSINEDVFVPRIPKISNPVLLIQETSCKADQADGAVRSSARIFINNILEMNGFFESVAKLPEYQGTDGVDVDNTINFPIKLITFHDINDGTSNTIIMNIIAPNKVNANARNEADKLAECNAVVVQTAKLEYLIASLEIQELDEGNTADESAAPSTFTPTVASPPTFTFTPVVVVIPPTFTPTEVPPPTFTPTFTPLPPPPDPMNASISGKAWNDANGNGTNDSGEGFLAQTSVKLGAGACNSTGQSSASTGFTGDYSFTGLAAGTYCVSATRSSNPTSATTTTNVQIVLSPGQSKTVNFGFQNVID